MRVKITPSYIFGKLQVPPSKSSMQRACAAALLHKGITRIKNPGTSNDDKAALNIITQLGAQWNSVDESIIITSPGFPANAVTANAINCGESGLSVRLFAPIAALSSAEIILTGRGSLLTRPMHFFDDIFPQLGVHIDSDHGQLPLKIKGPINPADITVDGTLSSQFLTGLLFAYCASVKEQVCIRVDELKSKPYIDLTIDVLKHFGYAVSHVKHQKFIIDVRSDYSGKTIDYTVEGDWSSASFLLVAGAIAGQLTLSGLDVKSSQADKAITDVLTACGAEIIYKEDKIMVKKKGLNAFNFDATDCPDLFPPLVALAAHCNGSSVITGIHRLVSKESNRAETLRAVFALMGVDILLHNDDMIIKGGSTLQSAEVSSYNDHRIAMAVAVAALGAEANISITHADAINKSYPGFFADLKETGAIIETSEA